MPVARFQLPDGRVARFEVPEGTSPEQAQSMIASYDFGGQPEARPEPQKPDVLTSGEKKKRDAEQYMKNLGVGIQGAADAASFGFGDEMIAGLKSWPAYLTDKVDFNDLYNQNLAKGRADIAQAKEESPNAFLAGQVAGAIGTGVGGAATKGGAAIANSLRSGNILGYNAGLVGRAIKAGALGSATGSATLFGAGEGGFENRLENVSDGALASGIVSGAIPMVGSVAGGAIKNAGFIKQGFKARGEEVLAKAAEAMKKRANQAYSAMRQSGAAFTPQTSQRIASDIEQALSADGIINPRLHDKTLALVKQFKDEAAKGDLSIESLDQWRQLFGEVAGDFGDKVNARKSSILIKKIDDIVNNVQPTDLQKGSKQAVDALNVGRSEYARMRKFESIADIIRKSDGDANALKRGLRSFYDDAKKTRGFNQSELAALKEASSVNTPEALMKLVGKFGFDAGNSRIGSGVGALVGAGAVGAAAGTGAGIVTPVVGTAARYGQKLVARGKAEKLLQAIEGVPQNATKGGLPAVISSPKAGQLAAPAGMVAGGQMEPVAPPTQVTRPNRRRIDPSELKLDAPPTKTVIEPLSLNQTIPANSLMQRIKAAESGGNPNADNPLSSASGLYQFTDSTWRNMVNKYGRKYGITPKDKNDPRAQEIMMQHFTQDNANYLQRKGIEPSDANLYFAHFMGAGGAAKAISMLGKNAIAARSFPQAAKSNPTIFFDKKTRRPRTVDEVYSIITNKVV